MADPRAVITLILLLVILFSPSPGPEQLPSARAHFQDLLVEERQNLNLLNSTRWRDFDPQKGNAGEESTGKYFNLTGLDKGSGFVWDNLKEIKERVRTLSTHAIGADNVRLIYGDFTNYETSGGNDKVEQDDHGDDGFREPIPLYKNITGVVHGDWVRSSIQDSMKSPVLNMTAYAPEGPFGPVQISRFGRNLTEFSNTGYMRVVFEENDTEDTLLVKEMVAKDRKLKRNMARAVRASINIGSEATGDEWEANVFGVHFLETGNMVFATTSEKFAGIFALPHLTVSEYNYGLAQKLLNRTLGAVIDSQEDGLIHGFNPWSSTPEGQGENAYAAPTCELVVYLQQHPVSLPSSTLPLIESELRDPTGAFPPRPNDMRFSLLAFSPDCGYVLESKGPPDYVPQEGNHLTGIKAEVEWLRARQHILIFSLALFLQILLLIRQMKDASTPSTRSRISFYTIAMLAMGDGYTTMTLCLASLFVQSIWIPLIGTAFLAFMSVSFFGMRFLLDIYTVQAPERERAERARREAAMAAYAAARAARAAALNASPSTAVPATVGLNEASPTSESTAPGPAAPPPAPVTIVTAAGADTLPLPVTTTQPPRPIDTGATPIFIPSDQDITLPSSPPPPPTTTGATLPTTNPNTTQPTVNANVPAGTGFGALYTRFYFLLLATLFLSLNATGWPPPARRLYFTTLAIFYLSLWLPQIHRNTKRNCRRALRWDFVLGQSVLRLVPFAYFYGYAQNVIFADVDFIGLSVLAAWVWIQVVVLASQELLGPRWFLPRSWERGWVPKAYDYHPLLREDEEGGNLPVGAAEAFAAADTTATPTSPSERKKSWTSCESGDGSRKDKTPAEGRRTFDCAICMGDLEVPVFHGSEAAVAAETAGVGRFSSGGALLLERRKYMVTPCRHVFHSGCLEGWMKYRLQCPVCREELPPV